MFTALGLAEETSFRRVWVPNQKGQQIKAVLTFSDQDKAIEIRPAKGTTVNIPYDHIDKCEYEFTDALMGAKNHWLEIHYRDQELPKVFVLLMDEHEYLHILDALKAHAGMDAEVLGNAKKR
jgi:LmbE family N-acetylglucosaminyl deacetylase